MAREMGISHTSVQRIWHEYGLKPHLVRSFKVSNDPDFVEKVEDIVGLYLDPPDKASASFRHRMVQADRGSWAVLTQDEGIDEALCVAALSVAS